MATPLETKLSELAAQALAAHGLHLVQARLSGANGRQTLEVLAEKPDGSSPTLDECTVASRTLSAQLDVADLISSRYVLEVGSPGWDRPLTSAADCARFAGRHARFRFIHPQRAGEQQLGAVGGFIAGVEGETIRLKSDDAGEMAFPFAVVGNAQLAPTKEEIETLVKQAKTPSPATSN